MALAMKKHLVKAKIVSFATPLKHILATTFGMPVAIMDEFKNTNSTLMHGIPNEATIDGGDFRMQTYRETYQLLGDGVKDVFGNDIFAHLACKQIEQTFDICDYIIIDDLRLDSEYWYVQEFFLNSATKEAPQVNIITVKVERPDLFSSDTHVSENGMGNFKYDHVVVNNGSIEDLQLKAQEIIDEYK